MSPGAQLARLDPRPLEPLQPGEVVQVDAELAVDVHHEAGAVEAAASGVAPPQTYGMPRYFSAICTALSPIAAAALALGVVLALVVAVGRHRHQPEACQEPLSARSWKPSMAPTVSFRVVAWTRRFVPFAEKTRYGEAAVGQGVEQGQRARPRRGPTRRSGARPATARASGCRGSGAAARPPPARPASPPSGASPAAGPTASSARARSSPPGTAPARARRPALTRWPAWASRLRCRAVPRRCLGRGGRSRAAGCVIAGGVAAGCDGAAVVADRSPPPPHAATRGTRQISVAKRLTCYVSAAPAPLLSNQVSS